MLLSASVFGLYCLHACSWFCTVLWGFPSLFLSHVCLYLSVSTVLFPSLLFLSMSSLSHSLSLSLSRSLSLFLSLWHALSLSRSLSIYCVYCFAHCAWKRNVAPHDHFTSLHAITESIFFASPPQTVQQVKKKSVSLCLCVHLCCFTQWPADIISVSTFRLHIMHQE